MSDAETRGLERRLERGEAVELELGRLYARQGRHAEVERLLHPFVRDPRGLPSDELAEIRSMHRAALALLAREYLAARKHEDVLRAAGASDDLAIRLLVRLGPGECLAGLSDHHAIALADGVAFDEEVRRLIRDSDGAVSTGGACDQCNLWDGEDRRCLCGNRRMMWSTSGHSFLRPCVFADAY